MKLASLAIALLSLAAVALPTRAADAPAPAKTEQKPIRVLLTFGGHNFAKKEFFAMWGSLPGITYTKAPFPQAIDLLKPGLEKEYDVIAMYDMAKTFKPEQAKAFTELLKTGIGVVSLHHNLCAHDDWQDYCRIIGGRYFHEKETLDGKSYDKSSYLHDQDFDVKVADRDHPITRSLRAFKMHDEAYKDFYVAPDAHILLMVEHPKCDHNVAWTYQFGNSRVFYLMFGHGPSAWQNPVYPELLVNGIRWTSNHETYDLGDSSGPRLPNFVPP
jgi:hypothetical protein